MAIAQLDLTNRPAFDPRIYCDREIDERELERIFARSWLNLCHQPNWRSQAISSRPRCAPSL